MSLGLPKGMSRDDAYIQGIADTQDRFVAVIDAHIPSLSDENVEEINLAIFNMAFEEKDADHADLAIRTCHCGARIDGFYDYIDHLKERLGEAGLTTTKGA
jgi:hypothetical protein